MWHFRLNQRISPYGIVFGAGPLVTTTVPDGGCKVKCVPLAAVTYPEDSARAMAGPIRRLGDIMDVPVEPWTVASTREMTGGGAIEFRDVAYRYASDRPDVLRKFSLKVAPGECVVIMGPSGVGKSSLMNRLFPGLDLRTAEISDSVNKGRHTTVGAVLHPLPGGGFVADTPGLREVGLWNIAVEDLPSCFPEFRPLLDECRFADCLHTVEPGCAIRDAVQARRVSRGRYESYVRLREELVEGAADFW